MAVRTTAGSDTIDTDFVGFFFCCCCSFKKKKKKRGQVSYLKSGISAVKSLPLRSCFSQMGTLDWDPNVRPAPNSNRAGSNFPNSQENGPASIQARREGVSGIEGNGVLNTFHFNGLQQSRLHICNHSFFNLILVSNTFSGPNTSKKCHHLIGRYSMPAWPWNQWFGVLSIHLDLRNSVNLHFRKGIILCGKHRQARLFRERDESCTWKVWWSALPARNTACPWGDLEASELFSTLSPFEVQAGLLNQIFIKPLTCFWN